MTEGLSQKQVLLLKNTIVTRALFYLPICGFFIIGFVINIDSMMAYISANILFVSDIENVALDIWHVKLSLNEIVVMPVCNNGNSLFCNLF